MKKKYVLFMMLLGLISMKFFSQEKIVPPDGYVLLSFPEVKNDSPSFLCKVCFVTIRGKTFPYDMKLQKYQKGKWSEITGKLDYGNSIKLEKKTNYAVDLNTLFKSEFDSDDLILVKESFEKDFKLVPDNGQWKLVNTDSFLDTIAEINLKERYQSYIDKSSYKNDLFAYDLLPGSGEIVINAYLGDSTDELLIPETIEDIPVGQIRNIRVKKDIVIKKLVISSSIKEIADSVFSGMGIENLVFSENSEISKIGSYCFKDNNIIELNLPKRQIIFGFDVFSNNQFKTISIYKEYAFSYKTSMGKFILEDCMKQEENSIIKSDILEEVIFEDGCNLIPPHAFANCKNIKTVSIPSSMKKFGALGFYGCGNLSDLQIDGISLASVKDYDELAERVRQSGYESGKAGDAIMGEFGAQVAKSMQLRTDPYSGAWTFVGCPLSLKTKQLLMKIGLPEYAIKE
ncbi:MAG: leucine-rich repeat domain-containing protein [Treponema sp.]|nr:leucine-rich repeat domain-containing protein [Treponema sp.]